MKVLALIESPDGACYRYRIEAFAGAMAERGLHLEATPLRRGTAARLRQLRATRHADAVILQRKLLPLWQLGLLRRSARWLIYDVDDAVFQRDSYSPKGPDSTMRMARFWATVFAADGVIVGNDYLRDRVADLVEPEKVHLIPTCLEPTWYRPAKHVRRGPNTRLVWIGQRSMLPSLQRAAEHLAAAARQLPGLELRVICDHTIDLPGVNVVFRRWSSATEAAELADGDIGVNWLADDSWSRGKCGLKVLQYMAAGLPVVANPVGMNASMVTQGQSGFLASNPRQWADAVARLAEDPALRCRMGRAGRELVERRYGVANWGPAFAAAIDSPAKSFTAKAKPRSIGIT